MVLHRQYRRVGADLGRPADWDSRICRSNCRRTTTMAASVPATTCSPRASSRWTSGPACAGGTISWCTTACGTWTFPCAPILADITVNGRTVKAVAQPTKQAFLYVLNRETGEPIWPFEERPVPKGDTPGEWYSPTQPFPTRPPAYDGQGLTVDDLIDFTPELRAEAATDRVEVPPRPDVHAALAEPRRGSDCHADDGRPGGRDRTGPAARTIPRRTRCIWRRRPRLPRWA